MQSNSSSGIGFYLFHIGCVTSMKKNVSDPERKPEQLLLDRATQGDEEAYSLLAGLYRPRIHMWVQGFERRYLGGESLRGDEAEDIVQDVLIKFWKNIHQFKGDSKLSTWLFSITSNHFKNQIKRHAKHERNISLQEITHRNDEDNYPAFIREPESMIDWADPESEFEANEQVEKMLQIIEGLPDSLQQAFLLRERDELTYQQIANEIGIQLDTVKTRLHRARKMIYSELEKWANNEPDE